MKNETIDQMKFFSEMAERQLTVREMFTNDLMDKIEETFGWSKILIFYFTPSNEFLSWRNREGMLLNDESHPYREIIKNDVIRNIIYEDGLKDKLTCFNVTPRLYKATDIIKSIDYNNSCYVRFLKENFNAHYSVTLSFGINAYINMVFLKTEKEGDFTSHEIDELNKLYIYVANCYKTYKKYEQANIVSKLQSNIITMGAKAYIITDDFRHILSYNQTAHKYLKNILGSFIPEKFISSAAYYWLALLLEDDIHKMVSKKIIKNYEFTITTHDQTYSNGIIDRYYWITILKLGENEIVRPISNAATKPLLTQTEYRVSELIYKGLTYKDISKELLVSYHTVKSHVQNIYTKCEVKSRFELSKWWEHNMK
ncbi:MAG: helix-turn-helix transcriptional regulator [Candidatus Epulonipiscium fishelsonii]|nr:MAG: helix-turn-helix transcriptional regulator [Epulopiscium sp. AS2M-Bin002]